MQKFKDIRSSTVYNNEKLQSTAAQKFDYCAIKMLMFSLIHARACGTCGMTIRAHEFMMRVRNRVYHASHRCFCCFQCERPLLTGDRFLADSKSLLCWECLQPLVSAKVFTNIKLQIILLY